MNKQEIQERVKDIYTGIPISLEKFTWDEGANIFTCEEDDLILNFREVDNITFNVGHNCILVTRDNCKINAKTLCHITCRDNCSLSAWSDNIIHFGSNATINCFVRNHINAWNNSKISADSDNVIITGENCVLNTLDNCLLYLRDTCTYIHGSKCRVYINGEQKLPWVKKLFKYYYTFGENLNNLRGIYGGINGKNS